MPVVDHARLELPRALLVLPLPSLVTEGERLLVEAHSAEGPTGETVAGTVRIAAGVPRLELDVALGGDAIRAKVRRPRLERAGSRRSTPAADQPTATPSRRTSHSEPRTRSSEARRW